MTSPTVFLEALLITPISDAYKGIEVEIVDMPGSFLTTDQDELINMTLRVKLSGIMVKIAP